MNRGRAIRRYFFYMTSSLVRFRNMRLDEIGLAGKTHLSERKQNQNVYSFLKE